MAIGRLLKRRFYRLDLPAFAACAVKAVFYSVLRSLGVGICINRSIGLFSFLIARGEMREADVGRISAAHPALAPGKAPFALGLRSGNAPADALRLSALQRPCPHAFAADGLGQGGV